MDCVPLAAVPVIIPEPVTVAGDFTQRDAYVVQVNDGQEGNLAEIVFSHGSSLTFD